jgi:hypothetical protein
MFNDISGTTKRKIHDRLAARLAATIRELGDRLYAQGDARAIEQGWQITVHRGGLARSYRDPRFDLFITCPCCAGSGVARELPCNRCSGSGRTTAGHCTRSQSEQGR